MLKTYRRSLVLAATAALMMLHGGCSDYVPEKATEYQARAILNNLSQIKPMPDPNVEVPAVYTQGPRIVQQTIGNAPEWKLFYFCRYHTSNNLRTLVNSQFAYRQYDKKGNKQSIPTYTISSNAATNQLIVRTPTRADVDSVLDLLKQVDVPPVQVRIDCLISELYADLTMDKEVTLKIDNLLGEEIVLAGKEEDGKLLPAFPGASIREPARKKFGLKVGYSDQLGIPGHEFRSLVDLLISRGYLKILMNPTLEVVNGQTATVVSRDYVPLEQVFIGGAMEGYLRTQTDYKWVVDSLRITPHVYADGYIGLETVARIGAKLTPEGITQQPIVTERTITNRENRIRHGESLIIGGIKKTEKRDVIRGVPVLKDIPVLGGLFSGRDFEERGKEVLFILTPTISTGGRPNSEMVDELREKHRPPIPYEELHKAILDPFGFDTRERERQRQLLDAEESRMSAEVIKDRARRESRDALLVAEEAELEAELAATQLEQAMIEAERVTLAATKLKAEAEKQVAEAIKAKAEAEREAAQARKELAEAIKSRVTGSGTPAEDSDKPAPGTDSPANKQ